MMIYTKDKAAQERMKRWKPQRLSFASHLFPAAISEKAVEAIPGTTTIGAGCVLKVKEYKMEREKALAELNRMSDLKLENTFAYKLKEAEFKRDLFFWKKYAIKKKPDAKHSIE